MRIWRAPAAAHDFKYSLFYGRPDEVVVLFDNSCGKGDHKHIGNVEMAYRFVGPEQLIEDFRAAVRCAKGRTMQRCAAGSCR